MKQRKEKWQRLGCSRMEAKAIMSDRLGEISLITL